MFLFFQSPSSSVLLGQKSPGRGLAHYWRRALGSDVISARLLVIYPIKYKPTQEEWKRGLKKRQQKISSKSSDALKSDHSIGCFIEVQKAKVF